MKVKLVLAAVRERLSEAKQSDQRMLSFVAEDKPAAFQQSSLSVWALWLQRPRLAGSGFKTAVPR